MGERPSGTVTFLFTDVEGSTASWEQHPDSMRSALVTHDAILRSAIGSHGGVVFATGGDGFGAAFSRADGAAVAEALDRIKVLAALAADDAAASDVDASHLTTRQLAVAKLVAQGFTNKQIAQRLGISRFTAETHVRNILERLGAASRSEIATWATRAALAEATEGSGTRSRT